MPDAVQSTRQGFLTPETENLLYLEEKGTEVLVNKYLGKIKLNRAPFYEDNKSG